MVSYPGSKLAGLEPVRRLAPEIVRDIRVVSQVLPFKVNSYVVEEPIDWTDVPHDPIYRLTFPHREMLPGSAFRAIARLVDRDLPAGEIRPVADRVRHELNPHPAGQLEKNVPLVNGERLCGVQHKYRETVLFFPAQGQTCHAYCGYCFLYPEGATSIRSAPVAGAGGFKASGGSIQIDSAAVSAARSAGTGTGLAHRQPATIETTSVSANVMPVGMAAAERFGRGGS